MLKNADVGATIAVKDLTTAKRFYGDTLGLDVAEEMEEGGVLYRSGRSRMLVYTSEYAGTNRATAATWNVDDVEGVVKELKAKGVAFEHYDLPDTEVRGDIHVSDGQKLAWFKDPDGNILALAED